MTRQMKRKRDRGFIFSERKRENDNEKNWHGNLYSSSKDIKNRRSNATLALFIVQSGLEEHWWADTMINIQKKRERQI